MAEAHTNPVFQIQRVYLKDLSLEQPNSPKILLEQQQPQVDINLALSAEGIGEGSYEVCVTATVTTKVAERTLFLVEAKQAGIFEIRNLPPEQVQGVVSVVCPQILYPYLRAIVSDVCTPAGRHARGLPADPPDRSQLPGDVRGATDPGRTRQRRQRQQRVDHHRRLIRRGRRAMRIAVLGAGAWGTALAIHAATSNDVTLW